jgi:8-oxo-dGTP pyrophosphatase MutT (NUDIX family)
MSLKKFYVGVKGLFVHNGKILVLKRTNKEAWDLPGGRIEDNNQLKPTLIRELQEEIGLQQQHYTIDRLLGGFFTDIIIMSDQIPHGLILFVFVCKLNDASTNITLSAEHSEYKWVTIEEAQPMLANWSKHFITSLSNLHI